jgi:hypothetical protein
VTRRLLLAGRWLLTGRRLFAPTARWHSPNLGSRGVELLFGSCWTHRCLGSCSLPPSLTWSGTVFAAAVRPVSGCARLFRAQVPQRRSAAVSVCAHVQRLRVDGGADAWLWLLACVGALVDTGVISTAHLCVFSRSAYPSGVTLVH